MKDLFVDFDLSDGKYLTALRLVAGAVCSVGDVPVDLLEDFKLCVAECAIILKNEGYLRASASFSVGDGVRVEVEGKGGSPAPADNSISLSLISALLDDCDIVRDGDLILKVSLHI